MYAEEIYDVLKDEMITNQTRDDAEAQSEDMEPTEEENKSASDNTSQNQSNEQSRSSHEPTKSEPLLAQEQPIDPEELEALQEELQEYFEQIFTKYKRQGELPKGLEIVVPELFSHKIDWREMLYFTDGMGTFPTEEPGYDLLWVMPETKEVPFGEVLELT